MAKIIQAGVEQARLALVGADGLILGNTTTLPSSTVFNPDIKLVGVQDMETGIQENDTVPVPGDNDNLGSFIFPSDQPYTMMINTGQQELAIDATLQGTSVVSIGNVQVGVLAPSNPVYPNVTILVWTRAQPKDSDDLGSEWKGYYFPLCKIAPMEVAQLQGRTAASFRYRVVAQRVLNTSWGVTIGNADFAVGTTGAIGMTLTARYPMAMARLTGAGSAGPYTGLNQTPSTTVADSFLVVNRSQVSIASITTAKTMTASSSISSGLPGVLFYGYTD